MILVESHKRKIANIQAEHPNAIIADVTSHAKDSLIRLSPFFPHGNIPVPYSPGITSYSVEGIWQGLKVFDDEGIDEGCFDICDMRGIKRTVRKHGRVLGHQKGVWGDREDLLDYISAKKKIYYPTYRWVLENYCMDIIERLRSANEHKTIILLDYNTCSDMNSLHEPISHAYLVKAYAEGLFPYEDAFENMEDINVYCGRKTIVWTTTKRVPKVLEKKEKLNAQLKIDFDF